MNDRTANEESGQPLNPGSYVTEGSTMVEIFNLTPQNDGAVLLLRRNVKYPTFHQTFSALRDVALIHSISIQQAGLTCRVPFAKTFGLLLKA